MESDSKPPMGSDSKSALIHLYKEMLALERTKAGIYANLWTFLFTGIAALVSIFISKPESNYGFLLIIPVIFAVWGAFAIFNWLYLYTLRKYIATLEGIISEAFSDTGVVEYWFKNIFKGAISRKASVFLLVIIGVLILLGIVLLVDVCLKHQDWNIGPLSVLAYLGIMGGLYVVIILVALAIWYKIRLLSIETKY